MTREARAFTVCISRTVLKQMHDILAPRPIISQRLSTLAVNREINQLRFSWRQIFLPSLTFRFVPCALHGKGWQAKRTQRKHFDAHIGSSKVEDTVWRGSSCPTQGQLNKSFIDPTVSEDGCPTCSVEHVWGMGADGNRLQNATEESFSCIDSTLTVMFPSLYIAPPWTNVTFGRNREA